MPLEQDWASAKVGLLKLAEDGLERTFEIVTQDPNVKSEYFEDNSVVLFGKSESNSFQSRKKEGFGHLVIFPFLSLNSQFTRHYRT